MLSGTGDKPTCAPLHTWSPELQSAYRILQDFLGSSLRHLAYVFINPVDSSEPGAEEYYDRIKEPMCLLKMKEKFGQSVYSQIGDFVCDFRLMLFNCYVFNGVDSPLGKLATKMETLFEQKIGLLARDLRERCSIGATMGAASLGTVLDSRSYLHEGGANNNPALLVEDPAAEWRVARRAAAAMRVVSGIGAGASGGGANNAGGSTGGLGSFAACRESLPVQAMARETEDAAGSREESDARIAAIVERLRRWEVRRHEERLLSEFESWRNSLATTETEYCLRHCAELAEVAHFLLMMGPEMLGLQASGLAEALTVREIHLALLSPQSSALLTGIMCGLFAKLKCGLARATKDAAAAAAAAANAALGCGGSSYSFYNRAPLPAIVYHHWHDRLKQRVAAFYRHLASLAGANDNNQELNQQQSAAVATSFLCSQFGDVVGHRNPLEIRMFHELSLFQRVHILKALIDCLLYRTDQFVPELDERCQPEEYREIRLGSVGQWVYIRLEGLDLEARHWVYRRSEYPVIEYCVQQSASKNSKKKNATPTPEKAGAGAASGRKRKAASPSPCQTPTPKSTSSTSRATAAPQLSLANGETNGKEKQEVEEEKVDDKTDENNDSTASANADASASTSASTAPAADEEAAATEAQADEDDDERDEENDKKLIEEMYKVNIERPNASEFELVAQTLSELRALISGLRDDLDALQRSKDEFDVKISKRGRKSKSVLAVDSDALNSQISSHRELLDAFVALEADWEAAAPKISHRERRMRVRVMHEFREFERNSDYYLRGELAEEAAMDSPAADEAAEDADYDDDNDDEIDSGSDELDEDDNNDDDGSDQQSVAMDDSNVGISTRRRKYRIRPAPPPPP
uniref:Bromo domain-containing protein n=1 Tax=Macrostomum lignano TaxID=282301 RepID=A0A1I8G0X5_9PLAT